MQGGTCSQTLCRRKNSNSYLSHRCCSNKTLASWVVECILTVLALEGCPSPLNIQAPYGLEWWCQGRLSPRDSAAWAKWGKLHSSVMSATPGEQEKGGCPDYQLFNTHLPSPTHWQRPEISLAVAQWGTSRQLGPGLAALLCG